MVNNKEGLIAQENNADPLTMVKHNDTVSNPQGAPNNNISPATQVDSEDNINSILLSLTREIKLLRSEASANTTNLEARISAAQTNNLQAINDIKEELKNIESSWDIKWKDLKSKQQELESEISSIKASLKSQNSTSAKTQASLANLDQNSWRSSSGNLISSLTRKKGKTNDLILLSKPSLGAGKFPLTNAKLPT